MMLKLRVRIGCVALALSAGMLIAGCGKSGSEKSGPSGDGKPEAKLKTDHQPADRWEGKVEIIVGGLQEYRELVASHKGKIVVADMWSTWCQPCIHELPNLAAMQHVYGDKVVCIAVALDYDALKPNDEAKLKDVRPAIEKAFRKAFGKTLGKEGAIHADFRLFISNENGEKFLSALKGDAQPTIYVYDPAGRVTQIDVNSAGGKEPTYEKHVVPVVDTLLK